MGLPTYAEAMRRARRVYLAGLFNYVGGNVTKAARVAGRSPLTVRRAYIHCKINPRSYEVSKAEPIQLEWREGVRIAEQVYLRQVMAETGGNFTRAALIADLNVQTFKRYLERHAMRPRPIVTNRGNAAWQELGASQNTP